jgi:hypothetical protein
MDFDTYMSTINNILISDYMTDIQDFPDEPFMDYYDDGLTCGEVVDIMMDRNRNLEVYFE